MKRLYAATRLAVTALSSPGSELILFHDDCAAWRRSGKNFRGCAFKDYDEAEQFIRREIGSQGSQGQPLKNNSSSFCHFFVSESSRAINNIRQHPGSALNGVILLKNPGFLKIAMGARPTTHEHSKKALGILLIPSRMLCVQQGKRPAGRVFQRNQR